MSKLWSPLVKELTPYTPGEQPKEKNLIKLNTNENPYGPSPRVLQSMQQQLNDGLRRYPDPEALHLKQVIAEYYSLTVDQVFVGNGSDEVLAHTFQALLKHEKPLLFPDISYSFYPTYCALYGIEYECPPLSSQFEIDVLDYQRANGGIIFPNPNAPTGILLDLVAIRELLDKNQQSVIVVDEAYIDFGGCSAIELVDEYPNLLVIQTLSKARSLAGLRVGLALGQAHLIEALERVKNSFNSYPLDSVAIAGAVAAFQDEEHFQSTVSQVVSSREKLIADLQALNFEVLPSSANFILTRHCKQPAFDLFNALREKGIIVRYFDKPRLSNYLRISIGTAQECDALVFALKSLVVA